MEYCSVITVSVLLTSDRTCMNILNFRDGQLQIEKQFITSQKLHADKHKIIIFTTFIFVEI